MRAWPNRAFSGRGYAARERGRKFRASVMRQRWGKDGDAAPLTPSLGYGLQEFGIFNFLCISSKEVKDGVV